MRVQRVIMPVTVTEGGVPITTVSGRLGHRDTATALNIHAHALPATDLVAASYLGSLLTTPTSA